MDFGFNDEQEMLRASVRRLLEDRCPLTRVRALFDDEPGFDDDLLRRGAELGFTSLLIPEADGGGSLTGQGLVDAVVVAEELGRLVQPAPFVPTNVVAAALAGHGTPAQRQRWLPGLAGGRTVAAWCAGRAAGGWAAPADQLAAAPDGAGWVLDGTASFVEGAAAAGLLLVTAATPGGTAQFVVPTGTAGVTVRRLATIDLGRRFARVGFAGVQLDDSAVLGPTPADAAAAHQLHVACVLVCADSVGGMAELVGRTVRYAKDRVQFGRPIGSYQAIKHRCADLAVTVEAARAATHYAALAVDGDQPDAPRAVSVAKSYVGDAYARVAGEALQIHGGIGFTWEHDVHLYLRRAKANQVLFGDPSWHREQVWGRLAAAVVGTAAPVGA